MIVQPSSNPGLKRKHHETEELQPQKFKKSSAIVRLNVNGEIIARFNSIEEVLEKTTYTRGTVEKKLEQSLNGFNSGWRYDNSSKVKVPQIKNIPAWPKRCIEEYNSVTGKVLRHYMTIEDAAVHKNIPVDRIKMYLSQPLSQRTTDPYGNGFCYVTLTEEQARRGILRHSVYFSSSPIIYIFCIYLIPQTH